MKLPGGKSAIMSQDKLKNYIFSKSHATGRFKALFFEKQGFNTSNTKMFIDLLREMARNENIKKTVRTKYGRKFILESIVETPKDRTLKLRTVWIIEKGQKRPRFITVYPV